VVVGHIQGGFEAKGEKMIKYLAKVLGFWDRFKEWWSHRSRELKTN